MIKEFTINFTEGLHARPAADLVKICQKAKSDIELAKDDIVVNPKSILGILSIGAGKGDVVTFTIEGEDEENIAQALEQFFAAHA